MAWFKTYKPRFFQHFSFRQSSSIELKFFRAILFSDENACDELKWKICKCDCECVQTRVFLLYSYFIHA